MAENVNTADFLSAWLCGDVRPEERAAIEQLLAANPEFKAQAEELRRLMLTLKQGELPVRPALLDALKQRVEASISERVSKGAVEALAAADLTNDLDAREKAILEKHYKHHPAAKQEAESLKNFSELLRKNERTLSSDASKKLIERLNAKLPAAAKIGKPTSAAMPAVPGSQRNVNPSVRVFAAPENFWPRRIAYGVAAAAVLAVVVGVSKLMERGGAPAPEIVKQNPNENLNNQNPKQEVVENQNNNEPRQQAPLPEPRLTQAPQVPPAPRDVANLPPDAPVPDVVDNNPQKQIVPAPDQNPRAPRTQNSVAQNTQENTPDVQQPNNTTVSQNPPRRTQPAPRLPDAFVNDGPRVADNTLPNGTGIGSTAIVPPQPFTNQTANDPVKAVTSDNQAIAAVSGMAVVGVVRGTAQARKPNGETMTLALSSQIPSGSDVITDESRIGLVLPGNGRLFVNTKTRLTLTIEGMNTTIALQSGEISYRAPAAGSLTLTAGAVTVNRAKVVDAEILNAALVVHVLDQTIQIGTKTKRLQVQAGSTATAALNGAETPKKELTDGKPDAWTGVLVFPGDGAATTPKTITNDTPVERKGRSRRAQ